MITQYDVLKPDVPRPAGPADEAHERWRREWAEKYPDWMPLSPEYNVRFVHNVKWREQLFSVQCAHDAWDGNFNATKPAHWFWYSMGVLLVIADLAWYWRFQ